MKTIKIGLVGAGMFGGDVHLRTYIQLQQNGIAPYLGRIGLDVFSRLYADVEFKLVALATRTEPSARRYQAECAKIGIDLQIYWGETPWLDLLNSHADLDILAVATPDHLHTPPILAALEKKVHVITEKPMTLNAFEADKIIAASKRVSRLVGVDMHKRYDPDHIRIAYDLKERIGKPLYATALLEEPIRISTQVFKNWAHESDPFSYVGCHWTDLFIHYFKVKPVTVYAVGQKEKLVSEYNIDAFDAVQVKVTFDNGMSVDFINNWILPDEFEAPVNQESRIVGTKGMIESDTQYRGLRYTVQSEGTHTRNTHFTRDVVREDESHAYIGYGIDSLIACIEKVLRLKFLEASLEDIKGTYPDVEEARLSTLIIHAAREVMRRNFEYIRQKKGAPVVAVLDEKGITVYDSFKGDDVIYDRPI
jgi:predicted dehydrogenase